jgi:hypothetical protein
MLYTTKLLVIANQTVDSDELLDALRRRAESAPIDVTLVAPSTRRAGERTDERLARAVEALREAGMVAAGIRADPDPMVALADVWDPRRFDEVVVATLPGATSRWLAIDLPRRVERFTGARVSHVVAAGSPTPAGRSGERHEHALR